MEGKAYSETVRDLPPPFLYKYRFLDRGSPEAGGRPPLTFDRDIIVNCRLWAGSPLAFNDPFDCFPFVDTSGTKRERLVWAKKQADRRAKGWHRNDRRLLVRTLASEEGIFGGSEGADRKASQGWRETAANFGVVSLTEQPADMLMWGYYADSHRGYCLEFATGERPFILANRVTYGEDRPVFRPLNPDRSDLMERVTLRKAAAWRHEREWRIATPGKVGPLSFPAEALQAIVLGANIDPTDEDALRALATESAAPITFKRVAVDYRTYALTTTEA